MTGDPTNVEQFIKQWSYDERSHEMARQMGRFLLQFLDYLVTTGLSEATLRRHRDNCWAIGKLECDYGYHDTFSPAIFLGEPAYLYDFKRKFAASKYAVTSYQATWRKLVKFVRSLGFGP